MCWPPTHVQLLKQDEPWCPSRAGLGLQKHTDTFQSINGIDYHRYLPMKSDRWHLDNSGLIRPVRFPAVNFLISSAERTYPRFKFYNLVDQPILGFPRIPAQRAINTYLSHPLLSVGGIVHFSRVSYFVPDWAPVGTTLTKALWWRRLLCYMSSTSERAEAVYIQ